MQHPSTMRAGQRSTVVIDPQAHVSRYVARRVRELIGQTSVWSIDGIEAREYRDLLAAGRRFPRPTLVRGTVSKHRLELSTDEYGRALGRCDCTAARYSLRCSHLLALAVHAVALGWEAA
jgi:hypothetical protein